MTSENISAGTRTTGRTSPGDSSPAVSPRLLRQVQSDSRDGTPEDVMASIAGSLVGSDDVSVAEELVTQSLDEILLALIALREDETHGTGLMEDMAQLFDVEPSPGTVYPRLHELDSDGTLERHDLVQTKQYALADDETASDQIERAMYEHLAVGLFLSSALDAV